VSQGSLSHCTVGKLSERNEAGDQEAIRRRNRSCVSRVGVAQPQSELYVRSQSWKWMVPLQYLALPPIFWGLFISHQKQIASISMLVADFNQRKTGQDPVTSLLLLLIESLVSLEFRMSQKIHES